MKIVCFRSRLINEGYERIQLSVYSGIRDPRRNGTLWQDMQTWLKEEENAKLYVLKISNSQFRSMDKIGEFDWDMDYLTGNKNSLFI